MNEKKETSKISILSSIFRVMSFIGFYGACLFLPAGTIFWLEGGIYFSIMSIYFIFYATYLIKKDPELIKERRNLSPSKPWDKIMMRIFFILLIPWLIIPGFDAVRFQWTQLSFIVKLIGFIGVCLSLVVMLLVTKENTYLASTIKIQEEREHKVITTGPYRVVRHPLYAGMIGYLIFHCLALGSLYSLIPGVLASLILVIRTHYEDKMLHEELKGYKDYASKTRYKLIPGIW